MSLLAVVSHLSTFPCHSLALTVSPLQENGWIPTTTKWHTGRKGKVKIRIMRAAMDIKHVLDTFLSDWYSTLKCMTTP